MGKRVNSNSMNLHEKFYIINKESFAYIDINLKQVNPLIRIEVQQISLAGMCSSIRDRALENYISENLPLKKQGI